jgi:hypothetical protein
MANTAPQEAGNAIVPFLHVGRIDSLSIDKIKGTERY